MNERLADIVEFCSIAAKRRRQSVYLIRCNEFYKVGVAYDVKDRLALFQTGCPYTLEIVCSVVCKNAYNVEAILHSCYEHKAHRGEWFKLDPEDVAAFRGAVMTADTMTVEQPAGIDLRTHKRKPKAKTKPKPRQAKPRKLSEYWLRDAQRSSGN